MNNISVLIEFRDYLIRAISSIKDSDPDTPFNDASPNSVTKNRLEELRNRFVEKSENMGIYLLVCHCDCGNEQHSDVLENTVEGRGLPDLSLYKSWGNTVFCGKSFCVCPCGENNTYTSHEVVTRYYIKNDDSFELREKLLDVFSDLEGAISISNEGVCRAYIREQLYVTLFALTELIFPFKKLADHVLELNQLES